MSIPVISLLVDILLMLFLWGYAIYWFRKLPIDVQEIEGIASYKRLWRAQFDRKDPAHKAACRYLNSMVGFFVAIGIGFFIMNYFGSPK